MGFRVVRSDPNANIPVRLVNAEVFVLGVGVESMSYHFNVDICMTSYLSRNVNFNTLEYFTTGNEPMLENVNDNYVPTSNHEFKYDSIESLNDMILEQFGNVDVSHY